MDFLPTRDLTARTVNLVSTRFLGAKLAGKRCVAPIHIGSGDPAKGPSRSTPGRDFAVVLAQTSPVASFLAFCPHIQSNRPKASAIE
jgi:hypothetical protein